VSELAIVQEQSLETIEHPSFHAVAVTATEMQSAKDQIASFLHAKTGEISKELDEMQSALAVAIKRKWAATALKNQVRSITKRKVYYDKLVDAVEAGYVIVPNMPCDIFAIRVSTDSPRTKYQQGMSTAGVRSAAPVVRDEQADSLGSGEGGYTSPIREFEQTVRTEKLEDGKTNYIVSQTIKDFQDIEFPLAAAHPVVMEAADHAMKKLIFDRIGIVPASPRKLRGDPIIVGQIVRRQGYDEKVVSFLIGWHLDVRTL
jgi:hypothetical protein